MQPFRRLQLALILGVGGLFFLASILSYGGVISNGAATAILAGACVAVLAGMLVVVRRAKLSAMTAVTAEPPPPPRTGRVLRATGFVVGILLIELTQVASLPGWARIMAGLGGAASIVLALVSLRRSRRG